MCPFRQPLARYLMPGFLAPFFGIPPMMYRAHHVLMHHRENNVFPHDLSSTEPYRRDSLAHWCCYWLKYQALFLLLPAYAARRGQWRTAATVVCGGCLYAFCAWWLFANGHGIFFAWQLVAPFLVTSIALMFGNWSQHMFVHPDVAKMRGDMRSIEYNCKITMNVINHWNNRRTFNDGYHITHHVHPWCHWSELPRKFVAELDKYAEHDAVVFEGTDFFEVGFNVMIRTMWDAEGAWRWVNRHFVHLTARKRSPAQVRAFLEARLAPVRA